MQVRTRLLFTCLFCVQEQASACRRLVAVQKSTEIPTIIDPSATINYPSATGSIIVGISLCVWMRVYMCTCMSEPK